jgi:hypothetical protein
MPFPILAGKAIVDTGYDIANSCRFNTGDSAYMHKTPGSAGSRTTWTWSAWVKRSNLDATNGLFEAYDSSGNFTYIRFVGDYLRILNIIGGSAKAQFNTTAFYRDTSSWYHIVWTWDTTNGTAGDRCILYVNGVRVTDFDTQTNPTSSEDSWVNNTDAHYIGSTGVPNLYLHGYMAEVCFIDGQALTPTSFGEFDSDSPTIWKPIDVSGLTFGTNGFYLDFEDSSNLGNDANGGTDFTEVNLAAVDQYIDSPTNNFATLNPLGGEMLLSQGNTMAQTSSGNDQQNATSTLMVSKGRWYAEVMVTMHSTSGSGRYYPGLGIADAASEAASNPIWNDYAGKETGTYNFFANGQTTYAGSETTGDASSEYATNDIVGIYLDLESGTKTLKFHKNGTEIESATIAAPVTVYGFMCNIHHSNGPNSRAKWNFGSGQYDGTAVSSGNADPNGYGSFEYSTTESSVDYYALCTKNIAEFG